AESVTEKIKEAEAKQKESLKQTVSTLLQNADVSDDVIQNVLAEIDQLSPNYTDIEQRIQAQIEETLDSQLAGVQISDEQRQELEIIIKNKAQTQVEAGVNDALNEASASLD